MFSINLKTGKEKVLYAFQGGVDGFNPYAGLIDVGGLLYGTTQHGGVTSCNCFGYGTVFSVNSKSGEEKVVYAFQGGSDGANPLAGLINVGGLLYGTTYVGGSIACGGSGGCGTVFSFNPTTGGESILHAFQTNDGAFPRSALIYASGKLYGTTYGGGSGNGTVFSVSPKTGEEKVVYAFYGGSDGAVPFGALVNVGGVLYGTTPSGGNGCSDYVTDGCGTLFSLNPKTGVETVLYTFQNFSGGAEPFAGLANVNGILYGTTTDGGGCVTSTDGCGTVFGFSP